MNKTWTITRSEYLRRVTSKGFIIATILAPIMLVAVIGVSVGVGVLSQDTGARTVAVLSEGATADSDLLADELAEALPERYTVVRSTEPADTLRARVRRGALDGFFLLPAGLLDGQGEVTYVTASGSGGFSMMPLLQSQINQTVREARIRQTGAPDEVLALLNARVPLRSVVLTEDGEAADTSLINAGIGYLMGFLIYIAVFVYGAMVLRGVVEEKANRIVEVIVSSAKPFELMLGKVLGIGLAGLTQFAAWTLLLVAALSVLGPAAMMAMGPDVPAGADPEAAAMAADLAFQLPHWSLFVYFLVFFLGGYLLYASLFAAVGSAVENEADAQSLQVPIMIPVILPALFLPFIADNPEAPLSIGLSLVPLFSPILMPVRLAGGTVAAWEIVASIGLLVLAFLGAIWLAARIYRVGILMYGKKGSFADMARWVRQA